MTLTDLHLFLDAWFIAPFRWITPADAGFLLGILMLALQSLLAGRASLFVVNRVQRRLRDTWDRETAERQRLSFAAIAVKDKEAYLAQNHLAQEAYGRSTALALGRFCAAVWPAVMALAWLDTRFNGVPFPLPTGFFDEPVNLSATLIFLFFLSTGHLAAQAARAVARRR